MVHGILREAREGKYAGCFPTATVAADVDEDVVILSPLTDAVLRRTVALLAEGEDAWFGCNDGHRRLLWSLCWRQYRAFWG
jgi:hypothetical protein